MQNYTISSQEQLLSFNNTEIEGNIIFENKIEVTSSFTLILKTSKNIIFKKDSMISGSNFNHIKLIAGTESHFYNIFFETEKKVISFPNGSIDIYFNFPKSREFIPSSLTKHIDIRTYSKFHINIHSIKDLVDINGFTNANYALIKDIDGNGAEIQAIAMRGKNGKVIAPFTGNFDGMGHKISNIKINCSNDSAEDLIYQGCGLFKATVGSKLKHNYIKNLSLENIAITGDYYIGALFGNSRYLDVCNIKITNSFLNGNNVLGVLGGETSESSIYNVTSLNNTISKVATGGEIIGSAFSVLSDLTGEYDIGCRIEQ